MLFFLWSFIALGPRRWLGERLEALLIPLHRAVLRFLPPFHHSKSSFETHSEGVKTEEKEDDLEYWNERDFCL
jgi:hypothetical protein